MGHTFSSSPNWGAISTSAMVAACVGLEGDGDLGCGSLYDARFTWNEEDDHMLTKEMIREPLERGFEEIQGGREEL